MWRKEAGVNSESLYETLTYLQLEQEDMERLEFFEQEYGSYGIHYDTTGDGTLRMDGRTVGHFIDEDNGGALWAANGCELSVTVERDDGEIAYFVVITEGDAESSFTVKAVEDAVKEMPVGVAENTREDVLKDETAVSEMLQAEAAVADDAYEPSEEDLKREQEYREAGITENPQTGEWLYDGRVISMLVDEDGGIYMNNMEDTPKEDRLYVIVERGEDGNVKGAKTVTLEDAVLSYAKNRY